VSAPTREPAPTTDDLRALIQRAQKGDKAAMVPLQEMLKDPATVDLFGGDLAKQAQLKLIDKFTTTNLLFKATLTRKLELLRGELSGPCPTPLEKLLVDRVLTCWLHLHHLETIYGDKESMTLELGLYYQRCITSAQKRYLAAIKTLALVRKKAVPVLQLNIARQQVNVAAACPPAGEG
jgi:hypothetical protein